MSTPFRLLLPAPFVNDMFDQAKAALPNECCGFLAGATEPGGGAHVQRRYPLTNTAASPVLYEADPRDLFDAERDMRRHGIEVVAIYHSHPTSEPIPSKTDRERNFYGSAVVHLIISLKDGIPVMCGWRLTEDSATAVDWEVV